MARNKQHAEVPEVFAYDYVGDAPATFMDLTAFGVGEVEPGARVEIPFAIVAHNLVPADERTETATAELVAVAYPELVPPADETDEESSPVGSGDAAAVSGSGETDQTVDAAQSGEEKE